MTRKKTKKKEKKEKSERPPIHKGRPREPEEEVRVAPLNPPGGGVPRGDGPPRK